MTTSFRKLVKSVAMTAPPIRRLVDSRQTLLAERNDAAARCEQYKNQLDIAVSERDQASVERDQASAERDQATVERARVHTEALTTARERDAMRAQNEALEKEKAQILESVHDDRDKLLRFGEGPPFVPNGHFYSPIPSLKELEQHKPRIFGEIERTLPGIDLNEDAQLRLLQSFSAHYRELPFHDERTEGFRYFYRNPAYGYSDAIFLNFMIRHARPRRVIEIGSGYSSCMLLDTNERWFGNSIDCTFIEPYPKLFHSLLKEGDAERVKVIPTGVQEVDVGVFSALEANDILFIDSTHVSKVGSDVNQIVFNVLPQLASGVLVHFHDIFYPFEYPQQWIEQGRAWNEAYVLRAFLQHNSAFEIVMFNTFMQRFHLRYFEENMPLCMKNPGASIWLRKR